MPYGHYGNESPDIGRKFDPQEIDWDSWNEARIKRYIKMNGEMPDGKRTVWHAQFMAWLRDNSRRPLIKYRLGMELTDQEWFTLITAKPHIEQELYTDDGAAELRKQQAAVTTPAPHVQDMSPTTEPKTRPEKRRTPQSHKPKYNVIPAQKPPSYTPGRQVNYTRPPFQSDLDSFKP